MNRESRISNLPFEKVVLFLAAAMCLCVASATEVAQPTQAVMRKFSKIDTMIEGAVRDASRTRMSDPLRFISRDMKSIVGDLSEFKTGQPVQQKEQQVVGQLDEIIKLLEQQCKNGKPGSALNPTKPMPDSKLGGGPGGINELTDPKASEKVWGNLTPKQREQILQSKTDGFPAGYESLLQSYYKRLAAEQVMDEKTSNAPTTAPSAK